MSGGSIDHRIMTQQAQIHLVKSEYHEAHNIQTQILQDCLVQITPYDHALALLNLAELGVSINAPKEEVQCDLGAARKIFQKIEQVVELTMCDMVLGDLYLREGDILAAEALFKQCLTLNNSQIKSYCLERLSDVSCWGGPALISSWTTVYLAHSIKFKAKLEINKALQFLGDIFLAQADEDTAVSLFIIALEGFTYMDVHRSRAECMLRFGDIAREHDDLCKAMEFWDAARPLFKRSLQTKQIELLNERIASVGKDVLEQQRMNLARLVEINAPTGIVEEAEDDLSDIEDLEDLGEGPSLVTV
jgi:tetratricopeptide (TPR) repeat protein